MEEKIYQIIEESINEINKDLDENIIYSKETKLMSKESVLDSFSLVNLIITIETKISNEFDKQITLVNDSAFSRKNSPFVTVKSLCNYILELLEK
ncbi:MAG: hypothetical protein WBF48_13640 [Halarcobacter sp.]